jgi:cytochrome b
MSNQSKKIKVWDPFIRFFTGQLLSYSFVIICYLKEASYSRKVVLSIYILGISSSALCLYVWYGELLVVKMQDFLLLFLPIQNLGSIKRKFRGEHPYYEGITNAGAVMIVCLLAGLLLTGATGWLASISDRIDGWQAVIASATDIVPWGTFTAFLLI